jgi:hypothetical protein
MEQWKTVPVRNPVSNGSVNNLKVKNNDLTLSNKFIVLQHVDSAAISSDCNGSEPRLTPNLNLSTPSCTG